MNGATVLYPGSIATGVEPTYGPVPLTNVKTPFDFAYTHSDYCTQVPLNGQHFHATRAISSGWFAQMQKGMYLQWGNGMVTGLAGIPNSIMQMPASLMPRQSIKYQHGDTYSMLQSFTWTQASGENDLVYTRTFQTGDPNFGTDNAAVPTRAAPGQLVFRDGSPLPIQTGYKPHTD